MTNQETILAFIDRINAHDVEGLADLMADDHRFIDAHGNEVAGKEQMIAGWRGYFGMFPDYSIEVNEIFENAESFAMFGVAGASFHGQPETSWRLPAALKAIVREGRVALWQVFADTKIPFEMIERASLPGGN
jgi:ketosteroid isomerase-like protein